MMSSSAPSFRPPMILVALVLVLTSLLPATGRGAPCESYPVLEDYQLGSLPLEYTSTFATDGSLAYVSGYQQGFQVIDLSDPVQPALLADFDIGLYLLNPAWLEPAGDVGFVGGVYGEIPIIDLSDPADPEEMGRFPLLFEVQATATEGDFLYAATYGRRSYAGADTATFYIIDVSDPAAPVQLAEVLDNHYWAHCLEVRDGLAYLGASSGFHVFDVSDPSAVVALDTLDFYSTPIDMQFEGDLLYALGLTGELHIIDVSDPANLVVLSTTDLKVGATEGISVHDGMAVIACRAAGVRVVDVSDPVHPSEPAVWATDHSCYGVLLEEDRICAMTTQEILFADFVPPEPVLPLSVQALDSYPYRQILSGDLLYTLQRGLHISDVSDPTLPKEIGFFSSDVNYGRMSLDGSVLYLAALGGGAIALDVSDPADPIELGTLTDEQAYSIHAANGRVVVGPRSGFVTLYDVTDPSAPVLLGTHAGDTAYRAYGVALAGDYLYMTTGTNYVLDISDPKNIHTVASLRTAYGLDLVADGEWIYTGADLGVAVLRFTAPATLELIATQPIPASVQDLHLDGSVLSVACQLGGVHVFDVEDPANFFQIGGLTAADDTRCVTADKDIVVIGSSTYPAANDGMIEIYPSLCEGEYSAVSGDDLPAATVFLSAAPNPFNPRVNFRFDVKQAGHANLSIFDLRGRRVVTLVDASVGAGPQVHVWNGLDAAGLPVASGSYVARLRTAGTSVSRQVTVLR